MKSNTLLSKTNRLGQRVIGPDEPDPVSSTATPLPHAPGVMLMVATPISPKYDVLNCLIHYYLVRHLLNELLP